MTLPLFVYGSMRDADVRALVPGPGYPEVRAEPAWMPGAAATLVPGEQFLSMTREYMAGWRRATRAEAEALWQRLLRKGSARGGGR